MRLAELAIKRAKEKYGKGWDYLGPLGQENAAIKEAAWIILGQMPSIPGFDGAKQVLSSVFELLGTEIGEDK